MSSEASEVAYVIIDNHNYSKRRNYFAALLALLFLIASWVAMAKLVRDNLTTSYDHPYFVIWTQHCGFVVCAWVIPFHYFCNGCTPLKITCSIWKKAFCLNCMLLTSDYLWYLSLKYTQVAVNNAIYQSNCSFVFLFNMVLLGEEFDKYRLLAMAVMIGGMLVVIFDTNMSSDGETESTVFGYALVIISVIMFALYAVMFEVFYPGVQEQYEDYHRRSSIQLFAEGSNLHRKRTGKNWETLNFVACMGVMNIIFMWIPMLIFNALGIEQFELPKTNQVMGWLFINTALGVTVTSSYLVGIAYSSPIFMSAGALLVVPVCVVTDYLYKHKLIPPSAGVGCCIIAAGFVMWIIRLWWIKKNATPIKEGEPSYITDSC